MEESTPFTLATLEAPDGGKAAIGINGSYYLREHLIGRMGGPITFPIGTGGKFHEI